MSRISERDLAPVVARINRVTGSPQSYKRDGVIQVGHYHLDNAYGAWRLARIDNEGGAVYAVTNFCSKRELYHLMHAYLAGLETRS